MTVDGKVPVLDAGMITAFLLSFQQVVGAIRSIWESQERAMLAEGLQNSTPNEAKGPVPKDAATGARKAADAADAKAEEIEGRVDAGLASLCRRDAYKRDPPCVQPPAPR